MIKILCVPALWVIWWCAFAFLAGSGEVRTVRGLALSGGLILVMVGAFTGAITVFMAPHGMPSWACLLILGSALVAGWLYDARFGVRRQARLLYAALTALPTRARYLVNAVRAAVARHNRNRSPR